jgi:SseB protein N-terminal domain
MNSKQNQTQLDSLFKRAVSDPNERPKFFEALCAGDIYLPGKQAGAGNQIQFATTEIEPGARAAFVFFSPDSMQENSKDSEEVSYVGLEGREGLQILANSNLGIVVQSKDQVAFFTPNDLKILLNPFSEDKTLPAGSKLRICPPASPLSAKIHNEIIKHLNANAAVRYILSGWIQAEGMTDPQGNYLLAIDCDPKVFQTCHAKLGKMLVSVAPSIPFIFSPVSQFEKHASNLQKIVASETKITWLQQFRFW